MKRTIILAAAFLVGCGPRSAGNAAPGPSPSPAISTTSPAPATAKTDDEKTDTEQQARFLVGIDDGGKMQADADDIRVKRVRFLLDEIVRTTGENARDIAASTDGAADRIRNNYGRSVTRQTLLEEMKIFYEEPKIRKVKPTYKDAIGAHVLLRYAK